MVDVKDIDKQNVVPGDKLNYKLIMQAHIDRCLHVRSVDTLEEFEKEVSDLEAAMNFNIEGVYFKDKIREADIILERWYVHKVTVFKNEPGRYYYNPILYEIKTRPWRYMKADAKFRNLIDLLAEHGALFESRKGVEHWREGEPS